MIALGALWVGAGSAVAAGTPIVNTSPPETRYLASIEFEGTVNPNGAATNAQYEYRVAGSEEAFHSLQSKSVGSGTTAVSFIQRVDGLTPHTSYETRLSATNSYGTTTSGNTTGKTRKWWVQAEGKEWYNKEGGTLPISFASTEAIPVEIKWTFGLQKVNFNCNVTSSGVGGNAEALTDETNLKFTNCTMGYNGGVSCNLASFTIHLSGNFQATGGNEELGFNFPEGCESPFGKTATILVAEPFFASVPNGGVGAKVVQTVALTGSMSYGTHFANFTVSGPWALTGENVNKKFGSWLW